MSVGSAVWAGLAAAWAAWLLLSALHARVPGIGRVLGGLVASWPGRLLTLAAWAGAGWHLFCQRP